MALVVDVPLNTVIADLDEVLRSLVRRELERHGFGGVDVVFDAPSKQWSGKLTQPTVDLFLYDLREAVDRATVSPSETRGNGRAMVTPPPLRLELTYAMTAWTKTVEDEHRLLSQALAVIFSFPQLPDELLSSTLDGERLREVQLSVGRPREEKADFWTSVGGEYKVSIDVVAYLRVESGATFVRGPQVRTQTVRVRDMDGPPSAMTELHRLAGTLTDAAGEPVADAWVALPGVGRWTATDAAGRWTLDRLPHGTHEVSVRTLSGETLDTAIELPGPPADLVLGASRKRR